MKPVDMTLAISAKTPTFPGSPEPGFLSWSDLGRDGYNLEVMFMSTHTGTHLDAPYHFAKGGKKVDQIPVSRLMGSGLLIRAPKARNSAVTKLDIVRFEERHGRIPRNASVFVHTGWQKNLAKKNYFTENPGLSGQAATYLASRGVSLVGTDSPSIDLGRDASFPAHRTLAKHDIVIVENLANLGRIKTPEFQFTVLPLKLKGASGSPVRAIAY